MQPNTNTPEPNQPLTPAPPPAPVQPQVVVSPDIPPVSLPTVSAPVTSGDFSASPAPTPTPQTSQPGLYAATMTPAQASSPRSFKKLIIALVAVLVIGGGSAAAYLGVVVPNKPENVLKTALVNTAQQKQSSMQGTLDVNSGAGGLAVKADINTATNSDAKAVDVQLNLTISGISFPVEARLVNKDVYIKVGDLKTIASLVNSYSPSAGPVVTAISSQLSNKWIVIDSTLLNESGAGCVLDTNWGLTQADIKLLEDQYSANPFVTIKSTSSDSVDGQAAEKFVLNINDDKFVAYGNNNKLDNLSVLKTLNKCDKTSTPVLTTSNATGDHSTTPITVWVDKANKRIVKVFFQDNGSQTNKIGATGSFTGTISYKPVSVTAPANAEPAIQVLTSLQSSLGASGVGLTQLLGSSTAN